jgi:hypothetical protein
VALFADSPLSMRSLLLSGVAKKSFSPLSAKPTSDRPPTEFTVPVYEDGEDEERSLP